MKSFKTLLMAALVLVTCLCACSTSNNKADDHTEGAKMLVCYFSATGTTAAQAQRLAELTGADLFEIAPEERYTDADLDWRDSLSRSSVEMHDKTSRPAIAGTMPDMSKYDIVFIGYPNWWNTHPTIINTFIEANDLSGMKIAPFMTSGGSNIINSEKELKESYPTLTFTKGLLMNDVSDDDIKTWIESL